MANNIQLTLTDRSSNAVQGTHQISAGVQGKPLVIKAQPDMLYQFTDTQTGQGPESLTTKRVGNNLNISFEGGNLDQPSLIIEDYYAPNAQGVLANQNSMLVGACDTGEICTYVPDSGDASMAVSMLNEAVASDQVLGTNLAAPLGFNPLLIVAPLALLALVGGGDGGSKPPPAPDKIPPVAGTLEAPDDTNNNAPVITGAGATPGAQVSVVVTDSAGHTQTLTTTVNGTGGYTVTPTTPLADGGYTATATVSTPDGSATASDNGSVDTTPPSGQTGALDASSDSGVQGDNITNDTTPTISGKTEPDAKVEVIVNGHTYTTTADGNGDYSITVTDPITADGTYTPVIKATDSAGNSSSVNGTPLTIDTSTSITIDTVAGDDIINAKETAVGVTVTGTAEPGATVVLKDEAGNTLGIVKADGNTGAWSVPLTHGQVANMGQGPENLTATATDAAGNTKETSHGIRVDTGIPGDNDGNPDNGGETAPLVVIIDDANNDGYINAKEWTDGGKQVDAKVYLSADSGDKLTPGAPLANVHAGDSVVITTNTGDNITHVLTGADISNGYITAVVTNPAEGAKIEVHAYIKDDAGNQSATGTDSAVLDALAYGGTVALTKVWDNQLPQPVGSTAVNGLVLVGNKLDTPPAATYLTNDTTPRVDGAFTKMLADGTGADSKESLHVYASITNGGVTTFEDVTAKGDVTINGTNWSFQDNTGYADGATVTYYAAVVDAAGNGVLTAAPSTGGYQVQIDKQYGDTKPAIAKIADTSADPDYLADAISVDRTSLAADVSGIKIVNHLGQDITGTVTPGSASANWQVRGLTTQLEFGQTAVVYAYDSAGNLSQISDFSKYYAILPSTGASYPKFGTTLSIHEDGNPADLVAQNATSTSDAHLTFSGTVTSTTPGELVNSVVFIYDNGNYVGTVTPDAVTGQWSFDYAAGAPGYVAGSHHNFTVSIGWKNSFGQVMDCSGPNIDSHSLQMNADASQVHADTTLVGAQTSAKWSDLLVQAGGKTLQIQGDAGDIVDLGISNGTGWVKTGTANGFSGDSHEYNVWQHYDSASGSFTQIMIQNNLIVC